MKSVGRNSFVRFRLIAVFMTGVMCLMCFSPITASAGEPEALQNAGIIPQGLAGDAEPGGEEPGGAEPGGAETGPPGSQGSGPEPVSPLAVDDAVFIVTLELNGGTLPEEIPLTIEVPADTKIGELPVPENGRLGFAGWWTEPEDGEQDGEQVDEDTIITEDITLYALWREAWVVTFDPNGGVLGAGVPETVYAEPNMPLSTVLDAMPVPENAELVFMGWWTEPGWTEPEDGEQGGEQVDVDTVITEDMTLYALWSEDGEQVDEDTADTEDSDVTEDTGNDDDITMDASLSEDGDVTFLAEAWEVTFDANGGVLGPGVPDKVLAEPDLPLGAVLDALPIPINGKQGFTGWWSEPYGGEQVDLETVITEDMVLYAGWSEEAWAVTFNANGGVLAEGVPKTVYVVKGQLLNTALVALPDAGQTTRKGYTLKGWYTAKTDGSTVKLATNKPKKNTTFYARWTAKSYSIEFTVNTDDPTALTKAYGSKNATYADTYKHSKKVVYAKKYSTYFKKLPVAKRTGYKFAGWYPKESGGSKLKLSSKISIPSGMDDTDGPITLYAKWTPKKYKITFNANGGKMAKKSKKVSKWKKNVKFDSAYGAVPGAAGKPLQPARAGYEFDGWWTKKGVVQGDGWGDLIAGPGEDTSAVLMTVNKKHTLYAKWEPIVYTIDFNANGGKEESLDAYQGFKKYFGTKWGLQDNTGIQWPIPERAEEQIQNGLIFQGWSLSAKKGSAIIDGKVWKTKPKDLTLYAQYTNKATITFNPNGGKVSPKSKTIAVSKTVYPALPTPTMTGHAFTGWFYETDDNDLLLQKKGDDLPFELIDVPQSIYAINLTAGWEPKQYKVSFNLNGGKGTAPGSFKVTYNETYAMTGDVETAWPTITPTKTGYTFKGWYTAKSGGKKITGESIVKITKNTTLYARWTANKYTVTFDATGGYFGSAATKKVVQTYDKNYVLPSKPQKPGSVFGGWYTKNGSGGSWGSKVTTSTVVKTAKDHTIYAKWNAIDISAEADVIVKGTGSGWHGKIVLYNTADGTAISFGIQHDKGSALGFPGKDCLMFESIGKTGQKYRAFKTVSSGKHHLKIEYDNSRQVAIGYCDGVLVGEMASPKMTKSFAVGFEASSRLTGDTVDATFTNLVIFANGNQSAGGWLESKKNGTFYTSLINNGPGVPAGSKGAVYATINGWHLWGKANLPGGDWDSYPEVGAKRIIGIW